MLHKPVLYSLLIWLIPVLVAPILMTFIGEIHNDKPIGFDFFMMALLWLFGCMLSIPSFLILLILNFQLKKINLSKFHYVGILLFACTLLTFLTFIIFAIQAGEISHVIINFGLLKQVGSYLICSYAAILTGLFTPSKDIHPQQQTSEITADNPF